MRLNDNVPPARWPGLVAALANKLGEDYDVILETDHIHVEFDPKMPY